MLCVRWYYYYYVVISKMSLNHRSLLPIVCPFNQFNMRSINHHKDYFIQTMKKTDHCTGWWKVLQKNRKKIAHTVVTLYDTLRRYTHVPQWNLIYYICFCLINTLRYWIDFIHIKFQSKSDKHFYLRYHKYARTRPFDWNLCMFYVSFVYSIAFVAPSLLFIDSVTMMTHPMPYGISIYMWCCTKFCLN